MSRLDSASNGLPHGDAAGRSRPAPRQTRTAAKTVSVDAHSKGRPLVQRRRREEVLLDVAQERGAAVVRDVPVRPRALRLHA